MKTAFILQHSYDAGEWDETKFIGVYSSLQAAESAIARLVVQPGFKERPDDFHISAYEIDKDHWTEGYVTVS